MENSGSPLRISVDNPDWARSAQKSALLPGHQSGTQGPRGISIESRTGRSKRIDSIIALPIALITSLFPLLLVAAPAPVKKAVNAPVPRISELVREMRERQYQSDKVRENYRYISLETTQDIDSNGQVKKTETVESQKLFVNTHVIEHTIRKNGEPLDDHDRQQEAERVTKLIEKARKTPPELPLQGLSTDISRIPDIVGRMLPIMEVRNPRRVSWHNRPTIVFDFVGCKDAKTHSLAEDT